MMLSQNGGAAAKMWMMIAVGSAVQTLRHRDQKGKMALHLRRLALPHLIQLMSHAPSTVTRYIAPSPLVQAS
jgi:hypothetical protein